METSNEKKGLHLRNKHRFPYDFTALSKTLPSLKEFISINKFGNESIDFANPDAVKCLNQALLKHFYQVDNWDIPAGYLCPPIPGRADYIHYIADLLASNSKEIPKGLSIKGLDIGTGANLVYPLIAHQIYGWEMLGTDIDQKSLDNAQKILDENPDISENIQLKFQPESSFIFKNSLNSKDKFTFSMCNPPFHDSEESAMKGNLRKEKNLKKSKVQKPNLNFSGQQSELWCEGGEIAFISKMIEESALYSTQILWFTCLVSKKENLFKLTSLLKKIDALEVKIIDMAQGQKVSRILAWTFIPKNRRNSLG